LDLGNFFVGTAENNRKTGGSTRAEASGENTTPCSTLAGDPVISKFARTLRIVTMVRS
jgi:hypothetical protein